jgi:hypothetical protein
VITIQINDQKIKIASELSEIQLWKGQQIMSLLDGATPSMINKKSIIALLSDIDILLVTKFDDESIDNIWKLLPFERDTQLVLWETFKLKGTLYGLKPLDTLTVREFAQIDYYLSEGETAYDYVANIIATLYRPITKRNKSLRHILFNIKSKLIFRGVSPRVYKSYEVEELKDEHDKNAEMFINKVDFNFGFGLIYLITHFTSDLRKKYPIIYKTDEQNEAAAELKDKNSAPEFEDIWGYYSIVDSISSSLEERLQWWEQPLTHFMKYLSYVKQKGAYKERET